MSAQFINKLLENLSLEDFAIIKLMEEYSHKSLLQAGKTSIPLIPFSSEFFPSLISTIFHKSHLAVLLPTLHCWAAKTSKFLFLRRHNFLLSLGKKNFFFLFGIKSGKKYVGNKNFMGLRDSAGRNETGFRKEFMRCGVCRNKKKLYGEY